MRPEISDISGEAYLSCCRLNCESELNDLSEETGSIKCVTIPCLCRTGNLEAAVALESTCVLYCKSSTGTGSTLVLTIFEIIIIRIAVLRRFNKVSRLLDRAALLSIYNTLECRLNGRSPLKRTGVCSRRHEPASVRPQIVTLSISTPSFLSSRSFSKSA